MRFRHYFCLFYSDIAKYGVVMVIWQFDKKFLPCSRKDVLFDTFAYKYNEKFNLKIVLPIEKHLLLKPF